MVPVAQQQSTPQREYRRGLDIPRNVRDRAEEHINAMMQSYPHLRVVEGSPTQLTGDTDRNPGNTNVKESSLVRYESVWRCVYDYSLLVGDYESALLLTEKKTIANPFPLKLRTAINLMQYMTQKPGLPHTDYLTNQQLFDVNQSPMTCQSRWRGSATLGIYRSALVKLHSQYPSTKGPYQERCPRCAEIPIAQAQRGMGCPDHPGRPQYHRSGNTAQDTTFTKHLSKWISFADNNYDQRHSAYLLPRELRHLREYLLSKNDLPSLMIWTILLVAVKGFLRMEEVTELRVEDIPMEHARVKPRSISALTMFVKGKRDNKRIPLVIWQQMDCPEFSAVDALLIWIALSGVKSGYIFPSKDSIPTLSTDDHPADGTVTKNVSYHTVVKEVKWLCRNILGKVDDIKQNIYGTLVCRKTGFLFAVFSIFEDNIQGPSQVQSLNIVKSARHSDINSGFVYISDMATLKLTLMDQVKDSGTPDLNSVGIWKAIHIQNLHHFARADAVYQQHQRPIPDLALWYTGTVLCRGQPFNTMAITEIFQKAAHMQHSDQSAAEAITPRLSSLIIEHVPQQHQADIIEAARESQLRSNERHTAFVLSSFSLQNRQIPNHLPRHQVPPPGQPLHPLPTRPVLTQNCTVAPNPLLWVNVQDLSNQGRYAPPMERLSTLPPQEKVVFSRDFRAMYSRSTSAQDKVSIYVKCSQEAFAQTAMGRKLDPSIKSFVYRSGQVAQCVMECHGGSIDSFLQSNASSSLSTFRRCSGNRVHKVSFKTSKRRRHDQTA